ncbi:MAG: fumarylacetoacetate hydrolase family protein, partial [Burkholderiales bacterium]
MKLITFELPTGPRHIGALLPDGASCVDFTAADSAPYFRSMLDLIDGGAAALDHARRLLAAAPTRTALSTVRLLAPVPEPRQMRDFLSFEQHVRQARANRHLLGIAGQ